MKTLPKLFLVLFSFCSIFFCTGLSATEPKGNHEAKHEQSREYEWLTNGAKSGSLIVTTSEDGNRTTAFEFNDRGRGPLIKEEVSFDAQGKVNNLKVTGHSYMGAPVDESFQIADGKARWQSTIEAGDTDDAGDRFYLSNDSSPEQTAMLARALLESAEGKLELLPNGNASISRLAKIPNATLYAINGLSFNPSFVWLDESNELYGLSSGSNALVPAGHPEVADLMKSRQDEAELEFYRSQSLPLSHLLPENYAVTNIHLVDVQKGEVQRNQTVTVRKGKIVSVSADKPDPSISKIIDGEGAYLSPGLWDMHTHNRMATGLLFISAGVTAVRDMGNNPDNYLQVRDAFDSGQVIGPRSFAAGIIEGRSPYSAPIRDLADTEEEAVALVGKYADLGYPQIKIYSSVHPDWVPAVARQAHKNGMRVSGHIPSFMLAEQAVLAGYDEIQHVNMLFLNFLAGPEDDTRTPLRFSLVAEKGAGLNLESKEVNKFFDLLVSRDVTIDPTVAIFDNMFRHRSGEMSPSFAMVANHFPPSVRRGMMAGRMDINEENQSRYASSANALLAMVLKLHEKGIRIVAGSDSLAGFGLHRELELYQKAGIPKTDILRLATLGAAELMGVSGHNGSITVGKQADFVLLTSNPFEDINAIRTPRRVFKSDRYFITSELQQAVGIKPFN